MAVRFIHGAVCSGVSNTHSYLMAFLLVEVVLLVLTLLFVEGAEEEKMETDADGQQPEKVNSV